METSFLPFASFMFLLSSVMNFKRFRLFKRFSGENLGDSLLYSIDFGIDLFRKARVL